MQQFSIDANWARRPAPNERDLAELRLQLDDVVLTRCVAEGGTRDYVRTSAVSLALWFADNWWRLRWESLPAHISPVWRGRHELSSAIGGVTLPPLMIYGIGSQVMFAPISFSAMRGGPLEFFPIQIRLLDGSVYEEGLDSFFKIVLESCARAQDAAILKGLIDRLTSERDVDDFAAWRRLEARLGFDPDQAPEGMMGALGVLQEQFGNRVVEEAASAVPGAQALDALEYAVAAGKQSTLTVKLEHARVAAALPTHIDAARPTWSYAEDAAVRLRNSLNLGKKPVTDAHFEQILGTTWRSVVDAVSQQSLKYAVHVEQGNGQRSVALDTKHRNDRRFEMARILGDAIWTRGEMLGLITRAKTERQRFQRAFAQAFLCPFSEVEAYFDRYGYDDAEEGIERAAQHFHVNPGVIRAILVSKKVLEPASFYEQLESA